MLEPSPWTGAEMYGHLLLKFGEDDLEYVLSEENKRTDEFKGLPGSRKAQNINQDGHVMWDGTQWVARMPLDIDFLCGFTDNTDNFLAALEKQPKETRLFLWVSVDRSRSNRLNVGTWSEGKVHVRIVNDPASDDPGRMKIVVLAPALEEAYQAVRDTLQMKRKLDTFWYV